MTNYRVKKNLVGADITFSAIEVSHQIFFHRQASLVKALSSIIIRRCFVRSLSLPEIGITLDIVLLESRGFLFQPLIFTLVQTFNASLAGLLLHFTLESGIEMVFYVVISSAGQELCDLRPPISMLHVEI
jgi:hypothetical protein